MSFIKSITTESGNDSPFVTDPSADVALILTSIDEKVEKHKRDAQPILAGEMSAYEAFKNGSEKAIASFIKLGQEGHVTQKLVFDTPPTKSQATLDAEILIKALLENFNSVKFVKHRGQYFALFKGEKYDLQQILTDVNFNQISLSADELKAYEKLLYSATFSERVDFPSPNAHTSAPYSALTFGEKAAINIYTGDGHMAMNPLLRGNIEKIVLNYSGFPFHSKKERLNLALKETLLHVAVAVSGLNRLPDYIPSLDANGQPRKYVYRGEYQVPADTLEARRKAVAEGGQVLWEMGFLSTAHTKPAEGFFSEYSQVGVMFKNIRGKDVSGLSQYPGEREILFPPTQIQWLYHKQIVSDIFLNRKMDLFIAKPVNANHKITTIEDSLAKAAWEAMDKTKVVAGSFFNQEYV